MVYLDNAATSFPKPSAVLYEQERCMRDYCGNPGRGSHALALAAAEKIYECRTEIADFFGGAGAENVVFTMNTTMALNMAIKGLLHRGDHVLISDMEHNAVFRPIYKLAREGLITYDVFPTMTLDPCRSAETICRGIEARIRPNTRMLICAHASNICSAVLPIEAIGALCRKHGIFFVVDAAQSAGHLPIHVGQMGIDALCAPGHKGLLGPQGSGFLLWGEDVVADTLLEGGSGFRSLEGTMPDEAPERYEAGTLPTPAIAGLCEGIRTVRRLGLSNMERHEREINRYLASMLSQIPEITLYAPMHRGSILLFHADGISADRMGYELDQRGFCVRAGYHCSALGHATLRTPVGGAVRVSPGFYNTHAHIEAFAKAVSEICGRN
ncbi:MAG: aminotransferase class V-fold PLP-dependent enzyme [Clostridia bacterium]|nr:aminotransferase class V-fold PLP-dependent enzyme [Clostridia bacterium]